MVRRTTEATEGTEDTADLIRKGQLEVALLLSFKEAKLSCQRVVRGGPEEAADKERGATTDQGL